MNLTSNYLPRPFSQILLSVCLLVLSPSLVYRPKKKPMEPIFVFQGSGGHALVCSDHATVSCIFNGSPVSPKTRQHRVHTHCLGLYSSVLCVRCLFLLLLCSVCSMLGDCRYDEPLNLWTFGKGVGLDPKFNG